MQVTQLSNHITGLKAVLNEFKIGPCAHQQRKRNVEAPYRGETPQAKGLPTKKWGVALEKNVPPGDTAAHRILVPREGLEPSRLSPLPPQGSVSTNSTTSANCELLYLNYFGTAGAPVSGAAGGASGAGAVGAGAACSVILRLLSAE